MAKVIFWKSAIDPTQKIEFTTDKIFLHEILRQLDVESDPLSVIINGEIPDDIPLDFEFKKDDVLEIRKVVHGNSSSSKNTWATVVGIVALVAATVLTAGGAAWWAAGVTLAGGVASGALRYRAAKLAARNIGPSQSEVDTEANALSLSSAQNEARPLQTIQIPMGSVRVSPDYNGQPYPGMWGGSKTIDDDLGKESLFSPGMGIAPENWTEILPVGHVTASPYPWPAYAVKIMPGVSLSYIDGLLASQREDFAPYIEFPNGSGQFSSRPIIVYHHLPNDPHYGRFSNLASLYLQAAKSGNIGLAITDYGFWFGDGSQPSWWVSMMRNELGFNDPVCAPSANGHILWRQILGIPNKSNIIVNEWDHDATFCNTVPVSNTAKVQDYMFNELNGGINRLDRIPNSNAPSVRYRQYGQLVFDEPAKRSMTHVFNFGIGDSVITDDRVGSIAVGDITNSELVDVNKNTWLMPSTTKSIYHSSVDVQEGADLANDDDFSGPESLVSVNDQNSYNFIYRSSPPNVSAIEFDLEGSLYESTNNGLSDNYVTFELQIKNQNDVVWQNVEPITFQNDGLSPIRITVRFNFFTTGPYSVRLRKVEKDENNNNNQKVASFAVTAFKWFRADDTLVQDPTDFVAQNVKGLFLVANTQMNGQTNRYSALVDSKCWVYDFDNDVWNWELTRNPAWWFLYFARGGFKNLAADGTLTFPWSPTFGWVNGPGHPENSEILFGCGMDDSRIDIEGIKDWASFCEEQNLFIDITFKDAATEIEILEKIANIGRASVSYYKGLLSVVYEDSAQTPVGLYGMGNIIDGSFSADYAVANLPSKVIGTYVNRDNDWETETVEAVVPFANPDDLNFITTTLDGVTTQAQAQREVNILAARQFFQKRTYTWKVDKEGLVAKRGDLVYLSHDSTQFSYSGRVLKFIIDVDQNILGIETTAEIFDKEINFVTLRLPNGDLKTLSCSVDKCSIIFEEEFNIEDAPYYLIGNNDEINPNSNFNFSFPEDYIFIAGPLSTTGKIVRISQIQPDEQMNFTLTAIDEDPAMWSYEYGPVTNPESFDDSLILSRVYNVAYKQLGDGNVKILWEVDGADFVKIVNVETGLLMNADGQVSFSRGEVILELVSGSKYTLRIEPFVIGSPYKQESKVLVVWA